LITTRNVLYALRSINLFQKSNVKDQSHAFFRRSCTSKVTIVPALRIVNILFAKTPPSFYHRCPEAEINRPHCALIYFQTAYSKTPEGPFCAGSRKIDKVGGRRCVSPHTPSATPLTCWRGSRMTAATPPAVAKQDVTELQVR